MLLNKHNLLLLTSWLMPFGAVFSQGVEWQSDATGKFYPYVPGKTAGLPVSSIFAVVNDVPAIRQPRGFDIKEHAAVNTGSSPAKADLFINFYRHYKNSKGQVVVASSHPTTISIHLNDPSLFVRDEDVLFREQTATTGLLPMFTDTTKLVPVTMGETTLQKGTYPQFGRNTVLYVIRSRQQAFFRPVTRLEYLAAWLAKLDGDIEKETKQLAQAKADLTEMKSVPALAAAVPEVQKQVLAVEKWIAFLKEKRSQYVRLRNTLTADEKGAPAFLSTAPTGMATMMNSQGQYVEKIEGRLPLEPAGADETTETTPVFTYHTGAFERGPAARPAQLMILLLPYREDEQSAEKDVLDGQYIRYLSFEKLQRLMMGK